MKNFLVSLLIILLLAQAGSKWMVIWVYRVNKEFIADNRCVNKAKRSLHCEGKCQLQKSIAAEENDNSGNPPPLLKHVQSVILFMPPSAFLIDESSEMNQHLNGYYHFPSYSAPSRSIFHPPALT